MQGAFTSGAKHAAPAFLTSSLKSSCRFGQDLVADLPTLGGFGAVPDPHNAWNTGFRSMASISGLPTSTAAHVQVGVDTPQLSGSGFAGAAVVATPTSAYGEFRPAGVAGRSHSDVQATGSLRTRNAASRGAMHALTPDDCPDGYAFPAGNNCEEVLISKGVLSDAPTGQRCRVLGCENTPPLPGTRMCAYHSQNALFMVETLDARGSFVRCFARLCRGTNTWEWASAFSMDSKCGAHVHTTAVVQTPAASAMEVDAGAAVASVDKGSASSAVSNGTATAVVTSAEAAAADAVRVAIGVSGGSTSTTL